MRLADGWPMLAVVWAGVAGERTKRVLVYVHGFSATSEEINRAVVDVKQVAESTHSLTLELHDTVTELAQLAEHLKQLSQS